MKNANVELLQKLYADFAKGDLPSVLAVCADKMTFQVPGKSPLAGKYDKTTFATQFVTKLMEFSGGSLKIEIHDILGSERHAVVLCSDHLMRRGQPVEYRTAHVWRFEEGKPVAWYEYPRDLYQYDSIWT
jgi:ketosteroid isomerase-like protein